MNKLLQQLHEWTTARVALNHAGNAIPMKEILKFNQARAEALDAVHTTWDFQKLKSDLEKQQQSVLIVNSKVTSRAEFLKRPDLGKNIDENSRKLLLSQPGNVDVVFIVSDGLSATAVQKHFLPLWHSIQTEKENQFTVAPIILAPFARVALSDEIGFDLRAKVSVIIIGERPGLTAYDSLGIYLTFAPKPGNTDSMRNCISNIHSPNGLSYDLAAKKLLYLLHESIARQLSGIMLKDEFADNYLPPV